MTNGEHPPLQALAGERAAAALAIPAVLAVEPRPAGGAAGEPAGSAVVVSVDAGHDQPPRPEEISAILGVDRVDIVRASPLKAVFADPEKYGVSPRELRLLEERFGYPLPPGAVTVAQPEPGPTAERPPESFARDEITYRPPDGVSLMPLEGPVRIVCHASPDAGWRELRTFLEATENELVVGMYELTAPHIGDAIIARLRDRAGPFHLVLDKKLDIGRGTKQHDRTEAAHQEMFGSAFGDRFRSAYAFTGRHGTFQSAYHIKLAVRDRSAFWLSSGSWQSSNQPPLDPLGSDRGDPAIKNYNREWHVVVEHEDAARVFAEFLEWDLATAEQPRPEPHGFDAPPALEVFAEARKGFDYKTFFEPAEFELDAGEDTRVVPLLTPDNYIEAVNDFVEGAETSLLVQNQSLSFLRDEADQDPRFTRFTELLAEKSHALDDFRLILRDPAEFFGSADEARAVYAAKGLDVTKIHFQIQCHNKGMIADGRRVLVGSHNLTNAGTTANRDASLLIESREVAEYYRPIFEHDWEQTGIDPPRRRMMLAAAGVEPGPDMERYSLSELAELDD